MGSTTSTVYSRIKYIRLMTNSISGYRLADVRRTQRVFTDIGVFNNKTNKVARNLRTNLNAFTERKAKKIIIYFPYCRVSICYLFSFVICYGRVFVTFFPLEESGRSRQGTQSFPLVFGFRKTISAGCLLVDPFFIRCYRFVCFFCEGWLWHVLCFAHNFSRFNLFYYIISCSGHKRGKGIKDKKKQCNRTIVSVKICYLLRIV